MIALALCYTHHLALFAVAAQGLFAGFELWLHRPGVDPAQARRDRLRAVGVALALVVGYLPWTPHLLGQSDNARNAWRGLREVGDGPRQVAEALVGTFNDAAPPGEGSSWAIAAASLAALIWQGRTGGRVGRYVAWTGLLPTLLIIAVTLASKRSLIYSRYFALAQLSWLLAIALTVARVPLTLERRALTAALLAGSSLFCLRSWGAIGPLSEPGMRAAVDYALGHRAPDEPILVRTPSAFFGALYYARNAGVKPLLIAQEASRQLYRGSPQLRDDDLITAADVVALRAPGVWLLSTDSYDAAAVVRFPLPEGWRSEGSRRFAQDYVMEKPLELEHYRIE